MTDGFRIGVVVAPHGVIGEVKVFPTTFDVGRYEELEAVMLSKGKGFFPYQVTDARPSGKYVIVKFQSVGSREEAFKLKGYELWVERKDAAKLEDGEYYVADLVGLSVVDDQGNPLGTLTEVITTGANDVYAVANEAGRTVLLPAIKDCIASIDMEAKVMRVRLMEGLEMT